MKYQPARLAGVETKLVYPCRVAEGTLLAYMISYSSGMASQEKLYTMLKLSFMRASDTYAWVALAVAGTVLRHYLIVSAATLSPAFYSHLSVLSARSLRQQAHRFLLALETTRITQLMSLNIRISGVGRGGQLPIAPPHI